MTLASRCSKLPPLTRRIVALLVAPLAVVAVGLAIWLPASYVRNAHLEWRDDARRLLAQAKSAPATQAALEQEIAAMRGSTLWSKFYAKAGSGSGAASLHADIGALLTSVQASAQSLTPIPAQDGSLFARIGVRFAASMRVNQLQSLMSALNRHTRYLRVERLSVVAPQAQSPDENPPLAVTMDVYAYELPGDALPRVGDASALAMRATQ